MRRVFKPSGMNTTRPTNTQDRLANRALGYTGDDNSSTGRRLDGVASERRLSVHGARSREVGCDAELRPGLD